MALCRVLQREVTNFFLGDVYTKEKVQASCVLGDVHNSFILIYDGGMVL